MKIGLTGSSGFIGKAIMEKLKIHDIIPLNRTKGCAYYFDLLDESSFDNIPKDLDILIHAAYVTQGKDLKKSYEINLKGTRKLFDFAKANKIKIIFISSCSAHKNAESFYGKSKFELETLLDCEKHVIVRPGFVVGNGGIFKRLQESIRTLKIIPLFWGGNQKIQIIGLDDLCESIKRIIERNLTGAFNMVHEKRYDIKDFYTHIAKSIGQKPYFFYFPSNFMLHILLFLEKHQVFLPVTSENLLGLKALQLFDSNLDQLNIKPASLESLITH